LGQQGQKFRVCRVDCVDANGLDALHTAPGDEDTPGDGGGVGGWSLLSPNSAVCVFSASVLFCSVLFCSRPLLFC
jgi:hypothetical protein